MRWSYLELFPIFDSSRLVEASGPDRRNATHITWLSTNIYWCVASQVLARRISNQYRPKVDILIVDKLPQYKTLTIFIRAV